MSDEEDADSLNLPAKVFPALKIKPGQPVCVSFDMRLLDHQDYLIEQHAIQSLVLEPLKPYYLELGMYYQTVASREGINLSHVSTEFDINAFVKLAIKRGLDRFKIMKINDVLSFTGNGGKKYDFQIREINDNDKYKSYYFNFDSESIELEIHIEDFHANSTFKM